MSVEQIADRHITPAECRAYGVAVADGAPRTGKVVKSVGGTFATVERLCSVPGKGWAVLGQPAAQQQMMLTGCARDADRVELPSMWCEYLIAYVDTCTAWHEVCHAEFETWQHTDRYNNKIAAGDVFAACPRNGRQN